MDPSAIDIRPAGARAGGIGAVRAPDHAPATDFIALLLATTQSTGQTRSDSAEVPHDTPVPTDRPIPDDTHVSDDAQATNGNDRQTDDDAEAAEVAEKSPSDNAAEPSDQPEETGDVVVIDVQHHATHTMAEQPAGESTAADDVTETDGAPAEKAASRAASTAKPEVTAATTSTGQLAHDEQPAQQTDAQSTSDDSVLPEQRKVQGERETGHKARSVTVRQTAKGHVKGHVKGKQAPADEAAADNKADDVLSLAEQTQAPQADDVPAPRARASKSRHREPQRGAAAAVAMPPPSAAGETTPAAAVQQQQLQQLQQQQQVGVANAVATVTELPADNSAATAPADRPATTHAAHVGQRLPDHLMTRTGKRPVQNVELTTAQQGRFVQRVARAIETAQGRDGNVRLRLSPPELGALRVQLQVRDGTLTAHIEAETQSAKAVLMDNLPALRDRLAEQGIRVEQFEVEVPDRRDPAADQQRNSYQQQQQQQARQEPQRDRHVAQPRRESSAAPREAPTAVARDGNLNVIV